MRWILMHIFVVEYSSSYGLQCVLSNSEKEKTDLQNNTKKHKSDVTLCNYYCA